jgi:hypothetical protein
MSDEERRKETYERIKKRLGEYRYRSALLKLGALASAFLFIFSLFPIVPISIIDILGLDMYSWSVPLWFLCIGVFIVLFWIFQRLSRKIEEKRGITLEEEMYVPAYETLCHFREYSDPNHPIIGSKLKAERRMQRILTLLGEIALPNVTIVREEAVQLWQLRNNLKTRLIPLMRKHNGNVHSSLIALVDYLSRPELPSLVTLNITMASLPEITEKNIYLDIISAFFKSSNLRHIGAVLAAGITALLIYYIDLNYFGASSHEAYALGVGSSIALVTLYVTYLGLTKRRELRT